VTIRGIEQREAKNAKSKAKSPAPSVRHHVTPKLLPCRVPTRIHHMHK
jgi:hypothetical protein